jgi:phosphoglycolate phosphatase-like HAD superfamily hydrolase
VKEQGTVAYLISFDIDGTLEFGDPPGGITVEMVRKAKELGFLIGSCSDRFPSAQKALWEARGIEVDFVAAKHMLDDVRARFQADRYLHIGDREFDQQVAERAGFEFLWDHEGVAQPWLAWLDGLVRE